MVYPEFINDGIKELEKIRALSILIFTSQRYLDRVTSSVNSNKNIINSEIVITESNEPSPDRLPVIKSNFRPDYIISVGGGSVLDTAKLTMAFDSLDFDSDKIGKTGLYSGAIDQIPPVINIVTVAGSGAEISSSAILLYEERKIYVVSPSFLPQRVIYSIDDISSVPNSISLAGVADSLAHIVESSFSKVSDSFSIYQKVLLIQNFLEQYQKVDPTLAATLSFWGGIFQDKQLVGPAHVCAHNHPKNRHSVIVASIMPEIYTEKILGKVSNVTDERLFNEINKLMHNWKDVFSDIMIKNVELNLNPFDLAGKFSLISNLFGDDI